MSHADVFVMLSHYGLFLFPCLLMALSTFLYILYIYWASHYILKCDFKASAYFCNVPYRFLIHMYEMIF